MLVATEKDIIIAVVAALTLTSIPWFLDFFDLPGDGLESIVSVCRGEGVSVVALARGKCISWGVTGKKL